MSYINFALPSHDSSRPFRHSIYTQRPFTKSQTSSGAADMPSEQSIIGRVYGNVYVTIQQYDQYGGPQVQPHTIDRPREIYFGDSMSSAHCCHEKPMLEHDEARARLSQPISCLATRETIHEPSCTLRTSILDPNKSDSDTGSLQNHLPKSPRPSAVHAAYDPAGCDSRPAVTSQRVERDSDLHRRAQGVKRKAFESMETTQGFEGPVGKRGQPRKSIQLDTSVPSHEPDNDVDDFEADTEVNETKSMETTQKFKGPVRKRGRPRKNIQLDTSVPSHEPDDDVDDFEADTEVNETKSTETMQGFKGHIRKRGRPRKNIQLDTSVPSHEPDDDVDDFEADTEVNETDDGGEDDAGDQDHEDEDVEGRRVPSSARRTARRGRYSDEERSYLCFLKDERGMSWVELTGAFEEQYPGRSRLSLEAQYKRCKGEW